MPIIVAFFQSYNINPLFFLGIFGIVVSFLLRRMKETFGKPMKDNIEEEEAKEQAESKEQEMHAIPKEPKENMRSPEGSPAPAQKEMQFHPFFFASPMLSNSLMQQNFF